MKSLYRGCLLGIGFAVVGISVLTSLLKSQGLPGSQTSTESYPREQEYSASSRTTVAEPVAKYKIPIKLTRGPTIRNYKQKYIRYAFSLFRHSSLFHVSNSPNSIIVADSTSAHLYPNNPLIIVQGLDGAGKLQYSSRRSHNKDEPPDFGNLPNAILLISHMAYEDRKLYRVSRTPMHTIYGSYIEGGTIQFNASFIPKIEVAIPQHLPIIAGNTFTHCLALQESRPIDVAFSGNLAHYADSRTTHHRRRCVSALRNLSSEVRTSVSEKKLQKSAFVSLLKKTKLFVSPFGNGEWSSKTHEAISYGAIPILPFKDVRMETLPNLVDYVPLCSIDFSDLEKVVLSVLKNMNFWRLRLRNVCRIMQNRTALYSESLRRVESQYKYLLREQLNFGLSRITTE